MGSLELSNMRYGFDDTMIPRETRSDFLFMPCLPMILTTKRLILASDWIVGLKAVHIISFDAAKTTTNMIL